MAGTKRVGQIFSRANRVWTFFLQPGQSVRALILTVLWQNSGGSAFSSVIASFPRSKPKMPRSNARPSVLLPCGNALLP